MTLRSRFTLARSQWEKIIPYKKIFFAIGTAAIVFATPLFYPNKMRLWGLFIGLGMLLDIIGILLTEKSVKYAKRDISNARKEINDVKDEIYYDFDMGATQKPIQQRVEELEKIHNKRM